MQCIAWTDNNAYSSLNKKSSQENHKLNGISASKNSWLKNANNDFKNTT